MILSISSKFVTYFLENVRHKNHQSIIFETFIKRDVFTYFADHRETCKFFLCILFNNKFLFCTVWVFDSRIYTVIIIYTFRYYTATKESRSRTIMLWLKNKILFFALRRDKGRNGFFLNNYIHKQNFLTIITFDPGVFAPHTKAILLGFYI